MSNPDIDNAYPLRPENDPDQGLSRRGFLNLSASLVAGMMATRALARPGRERLRLPSGRSRSRVVLARSDRIVFGADVHANLLRETLDQVLIKLTGKTSAVEAWQTLLKPDDIIGLKFNQSGQSALGTSRAMAETLVTSLTRAGFPPDRIVCIEPPPRVEVRLGTQSAWWGFQTRETDFGSGADQLARVLDQVTALINVPFLKTHNITGLTCALKNLSHGLIKHPARYHQNGCSPYIADIVALPQIRDKLRLNLVDGLRVVFDQGPGVSAAFVAESGILLASTDPVATDTVGLSILNDVRSERGLPFLAETSDAIPFLAAAHLKGLGVAIPHGIEIIEVRP